MSEYYEWIKVLHIVSMVAWMVGLFYLPRIFVYHSSVKIGSEADEIFKLMELRLLRIIMNPAMIFTFVFGVALAYIYGLKALGIWFHIKMLCVLMLASFHGFLAKCRKDFFLGKNIRTEKFYRIINEIPTILLIVSVIMVVIKPFD